MLYALFREQQLKADADMRQNKPDTALSHHPRIAPDLENAMKSKRREQKFIKWQEAQE